MKSPPGWPRSSAGQNNLSNRPCDLLKDSFTCFNSPFTLHKGSIYSLKQSPQSCHQCPPGPPEIPTHAPAPSVTPATSSTTTLITPASCHRVLSGPYQVLMSLTAPSRCATISSKTLKPFNDPYNLLVLSSDLGNLFREECPAGPGCLCKDADPLSTDILPKDPHVLLRDLNSFNLETVQLRDTELEIFGTLPAVPLSSQQVEPNPHKSTWVSVRQVSERIYVSSVGYQRRSRGIRSEMFMFTGLKGQTVKHFVSGIPPAS